jgi:hypothetical protein
MKNDDMMSKLDRGRSHNLGK